MLLQGNGSGNGTGNSDGSGNDNGNGTGNGSQDTTQKTLAVVSDVSQDIARALDVPRLVSSGMRVASTVMTFYSENKLTAIAYPASFDFMGIARIFLTPLNLGFSAFQALNLTKIAVNWIRVKVLGITFSSSTYTSVTHKKTDPDQAPASTCNNADTFVSLAGRRTRSDTSRRTTSLLAG